VEKVHLEILKKDEKMSSNIPFQHFFLSKERKIWLEEGREN